MNFPVPWKKPAPPDALTRAEAIGSVELSDWFGSKRACITIGEWGDAQLRFWGTAATNSLALEEAITKATAVVGRLS